MQSDRIAVMWRMVRAALLPIAMASAWLACDTAELSRDRDTGGSDAIAPDGSAHDSSVADGVDIDADDMSVDTHEAADSDDIFDIQIDVTTDATLADDGADTASDAVETSSDGIATDVDGDVVAGDIDDGDLADDGSDSVADTLPVDGDDPDVPCVAQCEGRVCGDDGCLGTCGTCDGDASCDAHGACGYLVRGRILLERRRPNAELTAIAEVETVPLADHDVLVSAGAVALGTVATDASGAFTLTLQVRPVEPLSAVVVAASRVVPPHALPGITVIDALNVTFPSVEGKPIDARRVWAWTLAAPVDAPDALDLGTHTITMADGSGALVLLADLAAARSRATAYFAAAGVIAEPEAVTRLGVLWNPTRTPQCLSCYFPAQWGPLRLVDAGGNVDTTFDRAIWLSGASGAPHQWTPSLSGHELGHWVMDTFSRLPNVGGSHAWGSKASAPLAWSEGFATFFAQWSLSGAAAHPRFFSMQQNVQYWVDLELIGTGAASDDTSLGVTFPLPNAAGALSQDLNEAALAAMLWDLYDGGPGSDGADADADAIARGDEALGDIALERLASGAFDRGRSGPDLVDYIDALVCDGTSWDSVFFAFLGFPWTGPATCPDP